MSYFDQLAGAKANVIGVLQSKGVEAKHLAFGGDGPIREREARVPTDARSEFLANRAMGDWAERLLASALRHDLPEWQISHFGETASIAAGDPEFRRHYIEGLEEVRVYGKRPDLLVFDRAQIPDDIAADVSNQPFSTIDPLADRAIGSIEVRSSKFEALKYMRVRAEEREAGGAASRDSPSFTVKVEDLVVVYRWLERKKISQAYFQVFFDSVFAINFLDIFKFIGEWKKGIVIETPKKSQEKSTIMIPITFGTQVGTVTTLPEFTAEHKVTRLGRHDAFVKPVGGTLQLNKEAVRKALLFP